MFWRRVASDALYLGDVFGKILTLVGLPGAILVVFLFYAEFVDRVTLPDVTGHIESIELRCAPRLSGYETESFGTSCGKAPLGVSFEVVLANADAIERQLVGVVARVTFDTALNSPNPDRLLQLAQIVEHQQHNDYERVVRMPWRAQHILPGESKRVELQFEALSSQHAGKFSELKKAIRDDPSPLMAGPVDVRLYGHFASTDEQVFIAGCRARLKPQSLTNLREKGDDDFVAIVIADCDALDDR